MSSTVLSAGCMSGVKMTSTDWFGFSFRVKLPDPCVWLPFVAGVAGAAMVVNFWRLPCLSLM